MNESNPDEAKREAAEEFPFWAHLVPFFGFFFVSHMLGNFEPWNWLAAVAVAVAALGYWKPWRDADVWRHLLPFAVWISLMTGLGEAAGWKYAVRTGAGLAALLAVRPWRGYGRLRWKNVPLALGVGVAVFLLWVGFESSWMKSAAPSIAEWYEKWLVGPIPGGIGKLREPMTGTPYDPALTGWTLFAVHMLGTSVVIAIIEEFFWRGFLYRWLAARRFMELPLQHWDRMLFIAVAALFGLEHAEWAAGIACGLLFHWVILRTGDIWAAVLAHGVTNFLLGLYVWKFGQWHFW